MSKTMNGQGGQPFGAAHGSAVRCKVQCDFLDGGITPRWSESRDWMSEEDALSEAAGCYRSGKYTAIRVRYSRKYNGRWQNCGSKPYPPNAESEALT